LRGTFEAPQRTVSTPDLDSNAGRLQLDAGALVVSLLALLFAPFAATFDDDPIPVPIGGLYALLLTDAGGALLPTHAIGAGLRSGQGGRGDHGARERQSTQYRSHVPFLSQRFTSLANRAPRLWFQARRGLKRTAVSLGTFDDEDHLRRCGVKRPIAPELIIPEVSMKCFVCGNDMRLTMVEPHDAVARPGFEYRTFQCESCGDTERRFVFDARASVDLAAIGPT
jgi:hypothetical protein